MAWGRLLWAAFLQVEDALVRQILKSPGFHRGVQRIHRTVQEVKYGRNPNEPLKPGEATTNHNKVDQDRFIKHFVDELKNQWKGTPTELPPKK
ncbi:hypothetical protein QBC38DRAFT_375189 [Podospora fimiseda]|uniref:Uncharacterized protein n=1 Tax=Podospora fimiseda TaxID=252190 RepID=A0AAN7BG51_9PEZI|nr:hypothetical protein QBC38DRAFT_375189 [Podospora fimiseda]